MTQKLNGDGREGASQLPDLDFKICNVRPKYLFFAQTAVEPDKNSQKKGNGGYSCHAARLPRAEGPFRALYLHNMFLEAPPNGPRNPHNLCTLANNIPKAKKHHILGYVAQDAIWSEPYPPATTHLWWVPPFKIALTDG